MRNCKVGVVFFLLAFSLLAEVKLSGKIEDMTLVQDGNPFVITDDLIIPAGKKLVITRGCIILFKPFTGIAVEGSLVVEGAPEKPVVFTTENDNKYNHASPQFPNPFDWNGILINQDAEDVKLANFIIKYSVYGLKSYDSDIIIENGIFSNNGQSNLTIKETLKNVADGIPFSYTLEPSMNAGLKNSDTGLQHENLSPELSEKKKSKLSLGWRKTSAYCAGGTGVLFVALGFFYGVKYADYSNKYSDAITQNDMDNFYSKKEKSLRNAVIFSIPGVIFVAGGVGLYLWDKKLANKKKVTFIPVLGDYTGVCTSFDF